MKATGIIRRIDGLGRIAIPKEIRRTQGIRDGDPFELFVSDGCVIFQKYQPGICATSHTEALRDIISTDMNVSNDVKAALLHQVRDLEDSLKEADKQ